MRSRISSSKGPAGTVFFKNIKRHWPLWAAYAFFVMWLLPGILYFNNCFRDNSSHVTVVKRLELSVLQDQLPIALTLAVIFGIVFALCVFHYLQTEKSCYFMHSLPVSRDRLFAVNALSGFCMMAVPNLLAYIVANLVCLGFGVNGIGVLSIWLLSITVEEMFFYSFAILCMMVIGEAIYAGVVYLIMIFIVPLMFWVVNMIYQNLFYGINSDLLEIPDNFLGILSPVEYFRSIDVKSIWDAELEITVRYTIEPESVWIYVTAVIAAFLLTMTAVLAYRKRKSESANELIALNPLKPVFKWGVGICCGLVMAMLLNETMFYRMYETDKICYITFALIVVFAVIGYLIAEMLSRKTVRVFKNIGRRLCVFAVTVALLSVALILVGSARSRKVGDAEDITYAYFEINGNGTDFSDADDIRQIIAIHTAIVDSYDDITEKIYSRNYTAGYTVELTYSTEDEYYQRYYLLPAGFDEIGTLIEDFINDNAAEIVFGQYYDKDRDILDESEETETGGFSVEEATIYARFEDEAALKSITLTQEESVRLYNAVLKDISEGYADFNELTGGMLVYVSPEYIESADTVGVVGPAFGTDSYPVSQWIEFAFTKDYEAYDDTVIEKYFYNYRTVYFNESFVNTLEVLENSETFNASEEQ